MKHIISLLLTAALVAPAAGQTPSFDPPLANRPAQFSNIVGAYRISAAAEPTEVAVEKPITLRVTIAGRGPAKYQPERKYLKIFSDSLSRSFYVEAAPQEDRLRPDEGTWQFVYRLAPRHEKVSAIDGIKLVYYQPPSGKTAGRFQTAYAEP